MVRYGSCGGEKTGTWPELEDARACLQTLHSFVGQNAGHHSLFNHTHHIMVHGTMKWKANCAR